jgi:hypothetical protein
MIDEKKYPRTAKFLREHPGMSLDDAIHYLEHFETLN